MNNIDNPTFSDNFNNTKNIIPFRGIIFIVFSAILFGTTGTTQALAPEGISSATIGCLRLIIGGPALLFFTSIFSKTNPLKFRPPLVPTIIAACGVVMFQLCFFDAVARTGVALGTIVAICIAPVFAGLLGAIFNKERLTLSWAIASLLAISGCVILGTAGGGGSIKIDIVGIFLAAGAGFGYAVSLVGSKKVIASDRSPAIGIAIILCVGALLVTPKIMTEDLTKVMTPEGLFVVIYLGLIATAAPYLLLATGLSTVPVSHTSIIMLAEPLTGCLLGVLLLGEKFTFTLAVGSILIFCGLVVISIGGYKNQS
ncbi:MAG: EamA family transporter [Desulfamplus sp.]|nr:EamA family transporter [Desulfamplus sp.]MBF0388629.1 EamA family transporter [Desulfamplus sp.]